jgi:hypothetical protein
MWYRALQPCVCYTGIETSAILAAAAATSAAAGVGSTIYQMTNKPDQPALPQAPEAPPPSPDDADTKARLAAAQARERKRKAGSLLTQPSTGQPLASAPVQVKSLLGQ